MSIISKTKVILIMSIQSSKDSYNCVFEVCKCVIRNKWMQYFHIQLQYNCIEIHPVPASGLFGQHYPNCMQEEDNLIDLIPLSTYRTFNIHGIMHSFRIYNNSLRTVEISMNREYQFT